MQRLDDENYYPLEKHIYLTLNDEAISEMEILIGARADENIMSRVLDIAKTYGINEKQIKKSDLRIR